MTLAPFHLQAAWPLSLGPVSPTYGRRPAARPAPRGPGDTVSSLSGSPPVPGCSPPSRALPAF